MPEPLSRGNAGARPGGGKTAWWANLVPQIAGLGVIWSSARGKTGPRFRVESPPGLRHLIARQCVPSSVFSPI